MKSDRLRWAGSGLGLRVAAVFALGILLCTLSACAVTFLHGLYDENSEAKDPDLVADQTLVGTWTMSDSHCVSNLTIGLKDQAYELHVTEHGAGCKDSFDKMRQQ